MLAACVGIGSMFFFVWLITSAKERWPDYETLYAILFALVVVGGMTTFFVAMFRWRVRCPNCHEGYARFTHDENDSEYLTCNTCDYSEKTGYTLGD